MEAEGLSWFHVKAQHSLLLRLPLLLQVAVSLQARFRGERTRRVPEVPLLLPVVQVRPPLVLWRHWAPENRGRRACDSNTERLGSEVPLLVLLGQASHTFSSECCCTSDTFHTSRLCSDIKL